MTVKALRVPLEALAEGARNLPEATATYVTRVHRLGPGALLVAFDPDVALEAEGEIVEVSRRGVRVRFDAPRPASLRPARAVTLIQAIGKGDKMDAITRDATELGVTRIVVTIAERSVRRPEPDRAARWRRVAIEAARQCGRGDAPEVLISSDVEAAVSAHAPADEGVGVCLHTNAAEPASALIAAIGPTTPVSLLVGPEGGWSPRELELAAEAGFRPATLGPLVLRTETVCAAFLGALLLRPAAIDPPHAGTR